jgi:membrane associated rhomboid family serine protease
MGHIQISISVILIALNVLVFFWSNNHPHRLERMLFITNRIRFFKEYDRLFLSGFIHSGILHLLFNCLTLYFFGPVLESLIGPILFLLLYLGSIIGGNLYCLIMRYDEHSYAALGASGGVLGVIFAFILLNPFSVLSLMIFPIPIPAWLFGILFTLTSIVLSQLKQAQEARISHEGHLGGALIGTLIVFFSGLVDLEIKQNIYFLLAGVLPIVLLALIKLFFPGILYKNKP